MNVLIIAGIGFVLLVILSFGIYFLTRRLAMRAIYGGASSPGAEHKSPTEPLYEIPMPRKISEPEEGTVPTVKNPLLEFIEEWEEPEAEPKGEADAEKEKPVPASKKKDTSPKEKENPLLKFIEEWEEPKSKQRKEKK
jgi:hypothetical protein